MYVTPKQRRNYFWTTIILIIGLPLTAFAALLAIRYYSGASGDVTPKNVIISNVSSNSISVSWTTDGESAGSISVNGGKGDSAPFIDIRGTDRRKTHHVDIVDLEPNKDYSFVVLSNDSRYKDEKGKSFKFRTAPVTAQTPVPKPLYGAIDGNDKGDAVVYVTVGGKDTVYPASSAATATGKWIVDLSALRDPATSSLTAIDASTTITLTVKGTDTLGGSVTGSYSELVDTEGQLKTTIVLNDVPSDSLYAALPKVSQISAITQVVNKPVEETPTTPEPEEEDPDVIATDVKWTAIPGTAVAGSTSFETGASSVQITNVTDSGFNVIWLSATAQEGSIKYGTSSSDLSQTGLDERDSAVSKAKYTAHSVKVTRLQAETKYFFEINSDATVIKDGSAAFTVTTFKTLSTPPEFKSITGMLKNVTDPTDAVVILSVKDVDASGTTGVSTLTSTIPDSSGAWVATIGDVRNTSGSEYFSFSDADTVTSESVALSNVAAVTTTTKKAIASGVTLSATALSSGKIVKVSQLSNYGIYASSTPSTSSSETGGGVETGSGSIPKTAISTPLIFTIIAGIISFLVGAAIYVKSNSKYRQETSKSAMSSSIN